MFYLLKRVDEKQCNIGDRVMVLADFVSVPAGTKGEIIEIYDEGVMIEWVWEAGSINDHEQGMCPLRDGFSRDELEYLGFETEKHPKL